MDIKRLIAQYPRLPLTPLPTPLEYAPNLTECLGGPKIYIKRDDLTALAFGGNKTRKLEFLLPPAVAAGADTIITLGGVQSARPWPQPESSVWTPSRFWRGSAPCAIRGTSCWTTSWAPGSSTIPT